MAKINAFKTLSKHFFPPRIKQPDKLPFEQENKGRTDPAQIHHVCSRNAQPFRQEHLGCIIYERIK